VRIIYILIPTVIKVTLTVRADYMQGTRLSFRTKEDAIHFAEKQGIIFCGVSTYEPELKFMQDGIILCMSLYPLS
jgi:hypothetical protein